MAPSFFFVPRAEKFLFFLLGAYARFYGRFMVLWSMIYIMNQCFVYKDIDMIFKFIFNELYLDLVDRTTPNLRTLLILCFIRS